MLTEYVQAAMREAHYELTEAGRFLGSIPSCHGAWGEGRTLEECREDLRGALESWIAVGLRFGHNLPVVGGIDINMKSEAEYAETDQPS
jgi:predicted RNase H-like HicB family nuclease